MFSLVIVLAAVFVVLLALLGMAVQGRHRHVERQREANRAQTQAALQRMLEE